MIRRMISKLDFNLLQSKKMLLSTFINKNDLTTELRLDLVTKLQSMDLRVQKSIILEQPIENLSQQTSLNLGKKKKNNNIFKILSEAQKKQLGLLVPHSPFNLRMTKKSQIEYRKQLCQSLYSAQKQRLEPSVRILQLENSSMNVDEYINSTYKDIFARYMVSRGYGVEWQANNSRYGVMNQANKDHKMIAKQVQQFYSWLLRLIEQNPLQKKQILGLYSYGKKGYTSISQVEVENVYKIGYFFTMPITKFGKFRQSFEVIQDRGQSIQLLVMLEDPLKLLNIQAICIEPNKKMIILSKYKQELIEEEQASINSYLITSMDVYTDHREYFNQNGYTKHSIFDSDYLLEMEVGDGVKMYNQIQGYSRKGGAYVIDRFSGLPDFQRSQQLELSVRNQYINEQGVIDLSQIQGQTKRKQTLKITDNKYQQKFLEIFKQCPSQIKKIDLYSTYQDQIYSYDNEKLHFKRAQKFVIPIPESNHLELQEILAKSIVEESKVKVPRLQRSYPKPRDRRRDKKKIRDLKEQQTEYMSLKESLQSIAQLSFSRIDTDKNSLTIPLFINETTIANQTKKTVIINPKIRQVLTGCIKIAPNENQSSSAINLTIEWDHQKLNKHIELLNSEINQEHKSKISIRMVTLTPDLFYGYRCFRNYLSQPELSNIVVEPQSKTEDVVPFFFHLHLMLHKMMVKQNKQSERGRRVAPRKKLADKMFSLVKFHPTIDQSQRNRTVEQILFGVSKANNENQHGYGLEALRLWIARHDSYLGDRKLSDKEVNKQLQLSAFIRKMYWQILPLMKINLDQVIINDEKDQIELHSQTTKVPRQKLSYLHNFTLDHINYYILNMQECYTRLNLSKALQLTEDFFKNYLNQIFLKTIRKRIIAYPLSSQTKQHIYVLRKILDLIAVIAPLLPYSVYHVTKAQMMQWPEVPLEEVRSELIPNYNRMTKLRVQVRNKFLLNDFKHSELVIPIQQLKQGDEPSIYTSDIWKLSKQDIQLFFDIQNISISEPQQDGKKFKLKLTHDHPIGKIPTLQFYQFKQICVRCSPTHHYGTHICKKCLDYLNNNFDKKLPLN